MESHIRKNTLASKRAVRYGFTLPELLIAMGIFTLGFVMVAAIFPTAILLQKRTIQQIESAQVAMNAKGLLRGRPYVQSQINALYGAPPVAVDQDVVLKIPNTSPVWDHWVLMERAYLGNYAPDLNDGRPVADSDPEGDPDQASYFWIPLLIYDFSNSEWSARVFVVRRDPTVNYIDTGPDVANENDPETVPKVRRYDATGASGLTFNLTSAEDLLNPGDPVLLEDGSNATVRTIEGNTVTLDSIVPDVDFDVWLVAADTRTKSSPALRIVVIDDIVK